MTASERWLEALWRIVAERLPPAPARVLELGCGSLGGLVPALREHGYDALGVDPQAPDGDEYRQLPFEELEPLEQVDVVVASTSLHHVADPKEVVDRIASALEGRGRVVVVEWAWEDFDEPTARWCFDRLAPEDEGGWIRRRRDDWLPSGGPWADYFRDWANEHGLHQAATLIRLLDQRFDREHFARGPYAFPNLWQTTEADEQAAIDAGEIQATRVDYVARPR